MKKFSVPCDFNGQKSPFTIYIGYPKSDHHPIHFQSSWLSKERGGTVPPEVMDSLAKLRDLSDQNGIPFEDLCVYALGAAQQAQEEDAENAPEGEDEPDVVADNTDDESSDSGDEGSIGEDSSDEGTAGDVTTAGDSPEPEETDDTLKKKK